jgi:hypothetical protein
MFAFYNTRCVPSDIINNKKEMLFNNMLFLSKGLQICVFLVFVVLILVFMKISYLESKLNNVDKHLDHCVNTEDFYELVGNIVEDRCEKLLNS